MPHVKSILVSEALIEFHAHHILNFRCLHLNIYLLYKLKLLQVCSLKVQLKDMFIHPLVNG